MSANVLELSGSAWAAMTVAQQQSAMIQLLTSAIVNGDIIAFASDPRLPGVGPALAFEWQFLQSQGFQLFAQASGGFIAAIP